MTNNFDEDVCAYITEETNKKIINKLQKRNRRYKIIYPSITFCSLSCALQVKEKRKQNK